MAAPRFLANVLGRVKMIATIVTSAGASDAEKVPSTNANGVLDPTLLNATVTSAGVGSANKIAQLGADGLLDPSVMPVGIGADTATIVASEALAAGDFVNIWDDAGTAKVRKADATTEGKEAVGFVLSAVSAAANATVYFEGKNTQRSGLTPGARQYLGTTPGACTATAPSANGNVVQPLGEAINATTIAFEKQEPITVA